MKKTFTVTVETNQDQNILKNTSSNFEKSVGALCYLPKSIYRLASRAAEDRDLTAKRFFFETMLRGLEQQGVITHQQHEDALRLPSDYGWKGRQK